MLSTLVPSELLRYLYNQYAEKKGGDKASTPKFEHHWIKFILMSFFL
uniref:Uncharacterized protein n=1 Tax=Rhizophora mucronata TaxID=61149 RepID=A0A2P2P2Z1_RHIMU